MGLAVIHLKAFECMPPPTATVAGSCLRIVRRQAARGARQTPEKAARRRTERARGREASGMLRHKWWRFSRVAKMVRKIAE